MKSKTWVFICALLVACFVTNQPCYAGGADEVTLHIPSPVRGSLGYEATFTCSFDLNTAKNMRGMFYWNDEGPIDRGAPVKIDASSGKVSFKLITRNPKYYEIKGYIEYLDPSGKKCKTNVASAGKIDVTY